MTRFFSLLVVLFTFISAQQKTNQPEVINFEQLRNKTISKDGTLYVVNFWATWCKPCVQEIPYFEDVSKKYAGKKVKVLLLSLDFLSEKEKVNAFIERKNIQNPVYLLNAGNPNDWIDKIDPTWTGAIPATVCYKNGQKVFFHEGEIKPQTLDSLIQTKL
jgi:thiol-disulfide isomerase/thioredoxin